MRQLGLPEPTPAQVRAAVGGGLEEAIARLAGRERIAEILPHYMEHWRRTGLDDVHLLPGATALIDAINASGGRSAVLTNKRGDASREVCSHLALTTRLAGITGAGDTPWLKPAPELTRHVLSQLGAAASAACYVGDSPYDVATARNAGLSFYGVTTGTHDAAQLRAAGAEQVFPGLSGVQAALGLAL